ncbi:hypothetical protein DSO57_1021654 [Entomophthora muscae]|uniref:Uncharacterized protein n=1 Tax=Entomophthora muscae TaxID=34485 RepID=A0ACC2TRE0_9FUNG|nr:hypothetical protein DSO57_1021654 [Entomophthora muscae]
MNHLIFTAVLTACLGIGGYQSGTELFGPSPEGLGQDSYYDHGQLNSSQTGPWPPLVSSHSTLSIAMYTSMYYVLTYFAGSFGRYNVHAKIFHWLMTVYPIVTALTGFQFANLLPYFLQVIPTITGYYKRDINYSKTVQNAEQLFTWSKITLSLNQGQKQVIQGNCFGKTVEARRLIGCNLEPT